MFVSRQNFGVCHADRKAKREHYQRIRQICGLSRVRAGRLAITFPNLFEHQREQVARDPSDPGGDIA